MRTTLSTKSGTSGSYLLPLREQILFNLTGNIVKLLFNCLIFDWLLTTLFLTGVANNHPGSVYGLMFFQCEYVSLFWQSLSQTNYQYCPQETDMYR